ncbi:LytR C-terminal domain-containing protein [Modestobacter versicolor]|uniref:LytR C-terminal domain-containing protein n=1 Tax=Modestobacter versicolor TaxID=429133 RepID=UPI0034DFE63A
MTDRPVPAGSGPRRPTTTTATDVAPARQAGPESDGAMTMPRPSRADRRREGLLPSGEDPLVRRLPARPAGGPPPGAGRRRTDVDPGAAPGRPPATGERRRLPAAQAPTASVPNGASAITSSPITSSPVTSSPGAPVAVPSRPSPSPRPALGQAAPASSGRVLSGPVPSGPMTTAAPAATTGRATPPPARPEHPSAPLPGLRAELAPQTTGMPGWASEPAPPAPSDHLTQRVSTAAPADSPWGAAAAGSAVPAGAAQAPARAQRAPVRPASAPPPLPPLGNGASRAPVEDPAPGSSAAPERPRKKVDVPVGGRAAARIERQAAEAAQKKSGRKVGPPPVPAGPASRGPGRPEQADGPPAGEHHAPRRVVQALVAVVVVAVAVLGFWSFTAPETTETSTQTPATNAAPEPSAAAPPVQETVAPAPEVAPAPVVPVRAPITVLNSTSINGLAADVGNAFTGGGWEVTSTGASPVEDVATTTVYFTEGDTVQQQAATQLVEQFPDVSGPVPRYFEVDEATPGLVVVATGNWRP